MCWEGVGYDVGEMKLFVGCGLIGGDDNKKEPGGCFFGCRGGDIDGNGVFVCDLGIRLGGLT